MKTGSWRKAAATLGVGALLLTACGGSSTATPKKTTTSHTNGIVVDGLFEEPNTLNPIEGPSMTYSGMVETTMFRNMFVTLPSGKLQPDLATTVPTVANGGISKDGLTYTLHIRKDANWSNGKPVTSQDVVTTWKLITNKAVTAWSTVGWSQIKSIDVVNSKEFKLHLSQPFAPLLDNAFGGIPAILPDSVFHKYLKNPAGVNKAAFNHAPTVTDGPFTFKNWQAGSSITVKANPNWYGPKPKSKEIVFKIIPSDNTLLANAQAHNINVFYFDPINQVKQLKAISGAKVHFTTQPAWESAEVNMKDPQLQSKKVRQALEMAINRNTLATKVWQGHATPVAGPAAPDEWDYSSSLKPLPYSPSGAKKLLKAAGYTMGSNGYLQKGGKELKVIYSTTSGNPWRAEDERLIQYWFKAVGVNMVIKNYPANAFFGSVLPSGKGWDLGEFQWGNGADPAAGLETQWECGASENFGSYCNHSLDKVFKSQDNLVTTAQRKPILQHAVSIMANEMQNLWLYSPAEIDTSINMSGYTPNPYSFDTWNSYDWQLTKG